MTPYVDSHCHVTTSIEPKSIRLPNVPFQCCIMSNNGYDWWKLVNSPVADANTKLGFGVHPWYSHLYYLSEDGTSPSKEAHYRSILQGPREAELNRIILRLPEPKNLVSYIDANFSTTSCDCIGEIGLDKLFRLPENGFYQGDDTAPLSRVKVKMDHQVKVFVQMCQLAVKHSLPVSLHCVKAPNQMFELCQTHLLPHKGINICLHSYTGSVETLTGAWLKNFPRERLFLSISSYVNFKNLESASKLLQALPLECILTETDFTWDTSSENDIQEALDFVLSRITHEHDLPSVERAKEIVYANFRRFVEGGDVSTPASDSMYNVH
ncbi:LADA_0H05886g1_1 [Lachancea dasiensis]|uniref:LADA_0H05886g1_1 n=1 Tax=Lachancea dasiensis TaxID=1072105 RepID=A0A1G4K1E3_9SACH|nr:LADA_0H05886g1_1 [Lachancea dasiensis]